MKLARKSRRRKAVPGGCKMICGTRVGANVGSSGAMWDIARAAVETIFLPTAAYVGMVLFAQAVRRVRVFQTSSLHDLSVRWDDQVYGHALILPSAFLLYPVLLRVGEVNPSTESSRLVLTVVGAVYLYLFAAILIVFYAAVRGPTQLTQVQSDPRFLRQRKNANIAGVFAWGFTVLILLYTELYVA